MTTETSPVPAASEAVRREWLRRIEAEYRSAALTHHLAHWLLQIGASPELFERAQRIVADELIHARLSHEVYTAAGGTTAPEIARESLAFPSSPPAQLERDLLLVGVEMFCIGETTAVRLFRRMRAGCDVPVARKALDRILRDEVRHRDFGWLLLDWMLGAPEEESRRALVEQHLEAMLTRLRGRYRGSTTSDVATFSESDRRWGLISGPLYREAVEETFTRDLRPRFAERGIRI